MRFASSFCIARLVAGTVLLCASAFPARAQLGFSFLDIDPNISVFGFNDALQIYGTDAAGNVVRSGPNAQNFVVLGSLDPTFPNNTPTAINNSGVIVGYGTNSNFDTHGFVSSGNMLVELSTLGDRIDPGGGYNSQATGINNAGKVVGYSDTVVPDGTAFPPRPVHAFTYQNGVLTDLGGIPSSDDPTGATLSTYAYGINEAGDVVGSGDIKVANGGYENHAFVYHNGQYFTLGTFDDTVSSSALAINNLGQSVGYSTYTPGTFDVHAFVHSGTALLTLSDDIGTFGGANSYAFYINDLGQVVGTAEDANNMSLPFLYQNHTLYRINDLLPASAGLTVQFVYGLSSDGRILGSGVDALGQNRYFILAVPEPGSFAGVGIGCGVLGIGFLRRKRRLHR